MTLFKKIGNLFATDKSNRKSTYSFVLQRNINPYDLWTVESEIGDGSFGKVYKAINRDSGIHAALKEVSIETEDDLDDHMIELSILNDCKHKNVVSLFEAYMYEERILMFLEYCGGGAVDNIMIELDKPLTEPQIRYTCHEICEGLTFLHKNFVIHRDIKAGNVLLTLNGMVKLADFGVSAKDNRPGVKHSTFIGTPYWMAPEVAICDAFKEEPYDCRADIWSLGITLIEMAQMQPPHSEMSAMRVIMRILKADPPELDRSSSWSCHFNDFLTHCLKKHPDDRWCVDELLKHSFIRDATDPKPILLLLAEFRADVCETQEEVTDLEVIKRLSFCENIVEGNEPSPTTVKSSVSDQHMSSDSSSLLSDEKAPSSVSDMAVSEPSEVPPSVPPIIEKKSIIFVVNSPSPVDPSEAEDSVIEEIIDGLVLQVLSDDVNSPSVPECVATAISEYVVEQDNQSAKTPILPTMVSKSAPEPKVGRATVKRQEPVHATATPHRRLPRSVYVAEVPELKVQSVGTDLETADQSQELQKRLSVAEMAKVLQVKLGHSSDSEDVPQKDAQPKQAAGSRALPRSSTVTVSSRTESVASAVIVRSSSEEQPAVVHKKQPPPLPPRHPSTTSSYQQEVLSSPVRVVSSQPSKPEKKPASELIGLPRSSVERANNAAQPEARDTIERSASRYRTLVRTRKFEFGGETVTTSTSHLIVAQDGSNATVADRSKAMARERRRHLRELKVLQRAENKAYQEMLTKSNLELDQHAKRVEAERDAITNRYENEEEMLRQQQKQNLETVERMQAREMKTLVKRLNEQQDREFKTLRDTGKEELKALEREIGRLPKDLRKQTLRIKTTMKQDELARREAEFARRQEEKMQLEKRTLAESHRGDLLRLEQQFLEQQQHIRRKEENEMAQLEERQVHEKHALSQRHILTAYKLKQQQMSTRHQRELGRLRTEADRSVTELKQSQAGELKIIPRKLRDESKVRLQMYKEKLRIEGKKSGISQSLGFVFGDSNREKIREFELEEKRRKEEYQDRVERRHRIALAKLENENETLMKETEAAHAEAIRQLADAEATKLNELDREFQDELLRCHDAHMASQAELEMRFKEELEDQRRFYHVPLSLNSSPNSATPVGVSIRSSKSSYATNGLSNDDSLSSGTASSSENHQRMYHSHHNGVTGANGGLPRSTMSVSDYDITLRSGREVNNGLAAIASSAVQQAIDRQKTSAIYTSEML